MGGRKRLELMEAESERKRKETRRGEREREREGEAEAEAEAGEEQGAPAPVSCNFGLVPMRVAACGDCSARLAGCLPPAAPCALGPPFLLCFSFAVVEYARWSGGGATPGRGTGVAVRVS